MDKKKIDWEIEKMIFVIILGIMLFAIPLGFLGNKIDVDRANASWSAVTEFCSSLNLSPVSNSNHYKYFSCHDERGVVTDHLKPKYRGAQKDSKGRLPKII